MDVPLPQVNLLWNYRTGAAKPDSSFPETVSFPYKAQQLSRRIDNVIERAQHLGGKRREAEAVARDAERGIGGSRCPPVDR
jgi:hypothetical protein